MTLLRTFIFIFFIPLLGHTQSNEKSFLFNEERNQFHIMTNTQMHNTNIQSDASETSVASESDFSIISQTISGEYFLSNRFSVVGSYYFALVLDIDAEIQGFDLGMQYYPFENGASKDISFMGSKLLTSPEWSPFIYIGASTRDYQFSTVSLKFQGIQLEGGSNWHFHGKYFLRGSVFFQQHLNNNVRTLTTSGASIGVGIKF